MLELFRVEAETQSGILIDGLLALERAPNAIERLEGIVEEMESDSLPLEDLLARYEEGLKLVKFCSEKLDAAEKRIEIIARDAAGKARLVEFEATKAAANGDSSSAPAPDPVPQPAHRAHRDNADGAEEGVRLF